MTRSLVAISLALAALLTGCGASRMERMTMAAGALHSVAGSAATLIDRAAEVEGNQALDACEAPGPECQAQVAAAVDRFAPAEAAQHLFAASVEAYVSAVITAASSDSPDWGDALRHLGDALGIYEALRTTLRLFDINAPSIPRVVNDILGEL